MEEHATARHTMSVDMKDEEVRLSAREFVRGLNEIHSQNEDEAYRYADMSHEGKRKCLESLEQTIQSLKKIQKNLEDVDKTEMLDNRVVQVLWNGGPKDILFTTEAFVEAFRAMEMRARREFDEACIPKLLTVDMEDNFILDEEKHVQPVRMCFIVCKNKKSASVVVGMRELQVKVRSSKNDCHIIPVEFVRPSQTSAERTKLRRIGQLLERLSGIEKEFVRLGAVRVYGGGGKRELSNDFQDKSWYVEQLAKHKALRHAGMSLSLHDYAVLAGKTPVDTGAIRAQMKLLEDEECDILIELREFQLSGVDFRFKYPVQAS